MTETDAYELVWAVIPALLRGAGITLQTAVQAGLLALAISVVVGVLRDVANRFVRVVLTVYVEFFRGSSAFVQVYWVFFVLPLFGVRLSAILAGTLVLGLNAGAYGSEIMRGALRAVPAGQREASVALNLSQWSALTRILIPQALTRAIIPFGNLLIDLLKGTALLSSITVTELAFAGRQAAAAFGSPLIIFGLVLLIYLVLATPIAWTTKLIDQRVRRKLSIGRAP